VELVWSRFLAHSGSTVIPVTTVSTPRAGKTDIPFCDNPMRLWHGSNRKYFALCPKGKNLPSSMWAIILMH